jgi:nitrogenase subunit NifH
MTSDDLPEIGDRVVFTVTGGVVCVGFVLEVSGENW